MTGVHPSSPPYFFDAITSPSPSSLIVDIPQNLTESTQTSSLEAAETEINIKDPSISASATATATVAPDSRSTNPTMALSTQRNTSQGSAIVCTEFHYFPKLPIELRLKIWKDALPGPRLVEIVSTDWMCYEHSPWRPACLEVAPSAFFACKESKEVTLKHYIPIRGTIQGSQVIWCDVNRDMLCFTYERFHSRMDVFIDEYTTKNKEFFKQLSVGVQVMYEQWDHVSDSILTCQSLGTYD